MGNHFIKNFIISSLSSKTVTSLVSMFTKSGIPIFMLHRMFPDGTPNQKHTPSYLRQCLKFLKNNGYHFISIAEILLALKNKTPLPKKSIAFTIDDGFHDQASLAAPVFIEFNCPVTIFLITGFIDGDLWPWFSKIEYLIKNTKVHSIEFQSTCYPLTTNDEKSLAINEITESIKLTSWDLLEETLTHLSKITQIDIPDKPPEKNKPMTWSMARELENSGVLFAPHTLSHPILSKISDEQSQIEINQSWQRLKDELQTPSPVFCYPNGRQIDYGKREVEIIKNTDMLGAVSTIHLQLKPEADDKEQRYNLPRYSLPNDIHNFIMYSSWIEYIKEKIRNI